MKLLNLSILLLTLIFKLAAQQIKQQQQQQQDDLIIYKPLDSYVELKGGEFMMGINDREGYNHEHPQRRATVKPMRVMLYPVSIASFKRYKQHKYKHKTDAEMVGHSWVFRKLLNEKSELNKNINLDDTETRDAVHNELVSVIEARWNRPEGGDSLINDRLEHPVTHVSYHDAAAYCTWRGMRLPTEIEWEYAARGGLKERVYPWGDYWEIGRTNLWQGKFPDENQLRDGHYGLAPVNAFSPQNNYEMYDLIGNVWEWTTSVFRNLTEARNERSAQKKQNKRCLKGGSFIDPRDGDYRTNSRLKIRASSRIGRTEKYTAQNVGFRCVQSISEDEMKRFMRNLDGKEFRVVRLRPPVHHGLANNNITLSNQSNDEKKILYKTEL